MPLPLLPLVIASLVAAAYHQTSKTKTVPKGTLTPERQMLFHTAMNETKDAETLRKLSAVYREQGLPVHADQLEKRAKLRELPEETKRARREVYRKAMTSQNPTGVFMVAKTFEQAGATGAAENLRKYAKGLPLVQNGQDKSAVAIPVIPAPMQANGECKGAEHSDVANFDIDSIMESEEMDDLDEEDDGDDETVSEDTLTESEEVDNERAVYEEADEETGEE